MMIVIILASRTCKSKHQAGLLLNFPDVSQENVPLLDLERQTAL